MLFTHLLKVTFRPNHHYFKVQSKDTGNIVLDKNGAHVGLILIRCAEELRFSENLGCNWFISASCFFFKYFILLSYATFSSPHLSDFGDILNQMNCQYSFLDEDSIKKSFFPW